MYEDRRSYNQPQKSSKVYISNLSYNTTEEELRKNFGQFGRIVDVSLKQKEAITFAFIEFESPEEAEAAVNQMNRKTVSGQELKVQFARGQRRNFGDRGRFNDRGGRGGYQDRGDRGSYRGRGGYDNDKPRRDFGDRPKGCFNCGEEGHMIKDCTKPRKPREYNNNNSYGGNRDRDGGRRFDRDGGNRRSRSRSPPEHKRRRKSSSDSR